VDPEVPGSSPGGGTISAGFGHPLNAHARFAAHTAQARGFGFTILDGADGYLFEVRDGSRRAVLACGSASPYALNTAAAMTLARDKGFAALAFARSGVPHIPGKLYFTNARHAAFRAKGQDAADALAETKTFPVFCKPVSGSKGDFAELIPDAAGLAHYFTRVAARHDAVLLQPFIRGTEHRVIVLHGKALCCYQKTPLQIEGTGQQTLAELVRASRKAQKPTTATLAPEETLQAVDASGYLWRGADCIPKGLRLEVLGPQNRSAGGDALAVVTPVPQPLATLAQAAAEALGLTFSGVDLFDCSQARDLSALCVIEANASPALQTLDAFGRMDLITTIWAANFEAALA